MTFVPGKVVKCPKCGASFDLTLHSYIAKTDSARCPQGHVFPVPEHSKKEEKKPMMKDLMTGRVLDGYIEARRVKTLEKFSKYPLPSARMDRVEELGRIMLEASDVGDWDRYNKAKEERAKLIEKMQREAEEIPPPREIGKKAKFYFRSKEDRDKAYNLLTRHNFFFPYGPGISMEDIDNPDYMLELLDNEGFDTSKIMVEKYE